MGLPEGWEEKNLGELSEKITKGSSPKWQGVSYVDEPGVLFVTSENVGVGQMIYNKTKYVEELFNKKDSKSILCKGDVLTNIVGASIGRTAIFDSEELANINQAVCLIRCDRDMLINKYLCYLLNSPYFIRILHDNEINNARANLSLTFFRKLGIPLPPLSEQKRIVAILDKAFAAIDKAIANTEKNFANARELFESYLNGVFAEPGGDWEDKTLGELTEKITKGSSPKWQGVSYVDEPGVLFITSENVGAGHMIYNKTKYVEESFNEKDSKSILALGDVLTNIVGASIGRTAIFDQTVNANINQAVCLMRCDPKKLSNKYLSYLLNSPFFIRILHNNEINNARANLSLTFFRKLTIPVPSIQIQEELVEQMDKLSDKANQLQSIYQQKLTNLQDLKQSILQKAFAGELTASAAAEMVDQQMEN